MAKSGKLELTWVGKDQRQRLEPRLLLEDPAKSYGDPASQNMLIRGDNLLALKALEQDFAGKVKCVFIDPPYNTGSAFEQYDDGVEHSLWLSLMRDRLEVIKRLLEPAGSLWITIDDNECHYLKVVCDEVFGRQNFVATCVWEKDKGGRGDADISLSHDNILIYAQDRARWATARNLLPRTEAQLARFKNPDNDPRGPWRQGDDGTAKSGNEKQRFEVTLPSGRKIKPPPGRYWAFSAANLESARKEGRAYFGTDGDRLPIIKRYLTEVRDGVAPRTWWTVEEVGSNQGAKRDHLNKLLPDIEPFATPKPESLLHRIIQIATNSGDLVLDSFLGSGTTAAVAHKLGRSWIGIEMGEHCDTHCLPRLKKVVDGADSGGITEATKWKGGGGFKYFELAETLLLPDDTLDHYLLNPKYDAGMLIRAICKIENFRYRPRGRWHGYSSEMHFIHVVTQMLNQPYLDMLCGDLDEQDALLIYCTKRDAGLKLPANVRIKRIPKDLLARCEFHADLK